MKRSLPSIVLLALTASCIYPFDPEIDAAPEGLVVVDADLVLGGASTVQLRSFQSLFSSSWITAPQAKAWVEDEEGTLYPGIPTGYGPAFAPTKAGTGYGSDFTVDLAMAPADRKYRLRFETLAGDSYSSDWLEAGTPPAFEDILFSADEAEVTVAVTLDGGADGTGYAMLRFDETWEFHSDFECELEYDPFTGAISDIMDYPCYWCWHSQTNYGYTLVDYTQMDGRKVVKYPLTRYSRYDSRNHRRYYINVKAQSIDKRTYTYLKHLEDDSASGGDLFTPNPGELAGNIGCDNDPDRPVFGYATLARQVSRRASNDARFLRTREPGNGAVRIPDPDTWSTWYQIGYRPIKRNMSALDDEGETVNGIGWGPERCINCLLNGGTQEKPDFVE